MEFDLREMAMMVRKMFHQVKKGKYLLKCSHELFILGF